jgi:hypothetical protein
MHTHQRVVSTPADPSHSQEGNGVLGQHREGRRWRGLTIVPARPAPSSRLAAALAGPGATRSVYTAAAPTAVPIRTPSSSTLTSYSPAALSGTLALYAPDTCTRRFVVGCQYTVC